MLIFSETQSHNETWKMFSEEGDRYYSFLPTWFCLLQLWQLT